MLLPDPAEHLQAVHVRHHHVEQHEIERLPAEQLECAQAAIGLRDLEAAALETARQDGTVLRHVVDDEKPRLSRGFAGRLVLLDRGQGHRFGSAI